VKQVKPINNADANGIYTDTSNLAGLATNTGNLLIQPLIVPHHPGTSVCTRATRDSGGRTTGPFVTAPDFSSEAEPAARYTMTQETDAAHPVANFVTLVHTFDRAALPGAQELDNSVSARVIRQSNNSVTVGLTRGGTTRRITFTNPFAPGGSATVYNAAAAPADIPRTPATAFPPGLETTRPAPLPKSELITSMAQPPASFASIATESPTTSMFATTPIHALRDRPVESVE
jgi:hypothetical protein